MKKGEIYEGIIEKVDFPNKGRIIIDGRTVTVKNGIPGQKVRFLINKKRGDRLEGRLLEVLEKSPLEKREPVCSIFPACGGCMYQTMEYEDQLNMKAEQVKNLLDKVIVNAGQVDEDGSPDYMFEGIKGSPMEFAYRNKMEFSFGDEYKDGPLALGLHKKGSTYDVLNAYDCKLVHEDMTKILQCVGEYFRSRNVSYYKKMQHVGYLRHLLLRRANTTGEILVNLVTTSQEEHDLEPLKEELLALPLEGEIVGFLHIINDALSDMVQSDETRILYGKDYFYEEILGLKFKVTPFSFFQPNSYGAEVLYNTAREYIGDTKDMTVFDLYSGTGTISQILSPVAKKVIGVEIVEEAVQAAKENAELNGIDNCRFFAGDVLKVIDEIEEKPDFIVLDPPRDGIHPKALPKIVEYGVEKMVYISCKPSSLSRDLEVFLRDGYRVERVCCVDQFCQTVHVETVVLLSQQKPDDTIEIDLDLDELDATSAELKATYQEIKDYVLKEFGLKVSSLYISQVKRKCGIEVGENYNLPKSENARVPQCPKEKEDAIKAALKYYAMI
ncbi:MULTISPECIES: 23S rRNA (uracil(1939)-C(5))-methyltransferase RlmD [Blautia]|uniref:23S rRNA (Uracil(1939)-C(5))-methyltransferase RlmD n=1 Tax=Blautia parvula TaxID=2877527 RepID=A0ABQ0BQC3_9FIRM|nr:23S rRNA (uracil(1939)-C(5))-methyltransferase RlmD [Blautia producta]MCB6722899.1 23S rRNA (uracil(1939)-C(5))-methyltransferase RlmD [Blautia marasmi]MCQ5093040.1 23S rRNA (uracil(1939)-C(5))-methyltransferase RlmD [Blautia producta]